MIEIRTLALTDYSAAPRRKRRQRQADPVASTRFENPSAGLTLGGGISVYHDATGGEFAAVLGPGGATRLTIYQFAGSYLSLAYAVSTQARRRFGVGRRLWAMLDVVTTRPLTVFLRLNCQTDRGIEPLFETIVVDRDPRAVAFDLDALRIPHQSIQSAWLDIIFSEPDMCEIVVSEVAMEVTDRGGA